MARSEPRKDAGAKKTGRTPVAGWAKLTWDDLETWAGGTTVTRGRTYQHDGRVRDLKVAADGELLATVVGGEDYATTVNLGPGRGHAALGSSCTCPVGFRCKHAVAIIAEYLQAIADGRDVPPAADDDPRWDDLDAEDEDEADEDDEVPAARPRRSGRSSRGGTKPVDWDDKIRGHLRAKSQGELADLIWSLTRRFPAIYQEFRERLALQEGDVDRLVAEARRAIRKVTSETAWQNHWDDGGHTPDYSPIRHRLERLLELGHADEATALGREFLELGLKQVADAHDEGEAAIAFGECLPVVFQALARSSLSGPDRLLFAIDALMDDDSDTIGEAADPVFDAPPTPEDWSAVADTLAGRLKAEAGAGKHNRDDFSRNYARDGITDWIATALLEAGRDEERLSLFETEARVTGSYERLVRVLREAGRLEDAERWAREGIAATSEKYPGIAEHLAASLGQLARDRKQWDVVAAHAARPFFQHPGLRTFDELIKAAKKAKVEEPVRAIALRFLETGARPYEVARNPKRPSPPPARRSERKKTVTSPRRATAAPAPESDPADRLKIDPEWPLPVPEELIPFLEKTGLHDPGPRPHLDVLLDMAIAANRPDDVLRWYDAIRARSEASGHRSPLAKADEVAEAVSKTHPERAIETYLAALNAQLPHAQPSAYETATRYLRKLRPIFESIGRASEWTSLLASIRETYRNRPRFMELLDRLDGQTIVQASKARRK